MRKLKYHEQKLLRKVNLEEWKDTNTAREQRVTSKYVMEDREQYQRYNAIVGKIRRLSLALAKLNDNDEVKQVVSKELARKLYALGLVESKTLLSCSKVTVSSMCERRLASVMARSRMCPDIQTASTFVSHGHVLLGTAIVKNPGILVSRSMEDFVTWSNGSKVKRKIDEFNGREDDFK